MKVEKIQSGILVMKYYNSGCVEKYEWNENNFHILKNIIKQTLYAIIYAFETKGFVHGDLHSGNVLLIPTINKKIFYENKMIEPDLLEAVIMDFSKSKINQINKYNDLVKNINKYVSCILTSNNIKLN